MDYESQISVDRAIEIVRSKAHRMELETVPLQEALGRVLGENVASKVDHPGSDDSALDGYACREADTRGATAGKPVALSVVGEVPAGSHWDGRVGKGEAVAIYTGAPLPEGADAVVGVEDTRREGSHVLLSRPANPGAVRPRGQDFEAGQTYLEAGIRLDAAAVALAAAMGHPGLPVARKPRIGILTTGDEVVAPGEPLAEGQVYDANGAGIAALVRGAGGVPVALPRALDDPEALRETLDYLGGVDLLLTSGGVSMGKYDFVRDLLFEEGRVWFWKVAMRPGGPALFGDWQGLPVFGLPGNPVSSLLSFELVARAFLAEALGERAPLPYRRRLRAKAASRFAGAGPKEVFHRGILAFDGDSGTYRVASTGNQSSGVLLSLHEATALVVVPPRQDVGEGAWVEVIAWPDGCGAGVRGPFG